MDAAAEHAGIKFQLSQLVEAFAIIVTNCLAELLRRTLKWAVPSYQFCTDVQGASANVGASVL